MELRRVLVVNLKVMAQMCNVPDLMELAVQRPTVLIGCIALGAIQVQFTLLQYIARFERHCVHLTTDVTDSITVTCLNRPSWEIKERKKRDRK